MRTLHAHLCPGIDTMPEPFDGCINPTPHTHGCALLACLTTLPKRMSQRLVVIARAPGQCSEKAWNQGHTRGRRLLGSWSRCCKISSALYRAEKCISSIASFCKPTQRCSCTAPVVMCFERTLLLCHTMCEACVITYRSIKALGTRLLCTMVQCPLHAIKRGLLCLQTRLSEISLCAESHRSGTET